MSRSDMLFMLLIMGLIIGVLVSDMMYQVPAVPPAND
jgi:hypothetical protein